MARAANGDPRYRIHSDLLFNYHLCRSTLLLVNRPPPLQFATLRGALGTATVREARPDYRGASLFLLNCAYVQRFINLLFPYVLPLFPSSYCTLYVVCEVAFVLVSDEVL